MDSSAPPEKVVVLLKATGDAPILKQSKFKVLKSEKFVFISEFLRKNLKLDNVVSMLFRPRLCFTVFFSLAPR